MKRTNKNGRWFHLCHAWILFALLSFPQTIFSQMLAVPIDPIAVTLPKQIQADIQPMSAEGKVNYLLQYAQQKEEKSPLVALSCAQKALQYSEKLGPELLVARSLYWLSLLELKTTKNAQDLDLPLSRVGLALQSFADQDEDLWLVKAYDLQANILLDLNRTQPATEALNLAFALDALVEEKASEWKQALAGLHVRKAILLSKTEGRLQPILDQLAIGYDLYEEVSDTAGMALIQLNRAALADWSEKPALYQEILRLYTQLGFRERVKMTHQRFGKECINRYKDGAEEEWFQLGVSNLHQAKSIQKDCQVLDLLGYAHHAKAARIGNSLEEILFYADSANQYYLSAIQYAKAEGNSPCLERVVKDITATCMLNNSCAIVGDSLAESYGLILESLKTNQEEVRKFQLEKAAAAAQLKRSNLIKTGIISMLIASLVFIGIYIRRLNKSLAFERAASQARQEASKAQMNPHFISNSLNAIDAVVNFGNRRDASKYLIQFSRLARLILYHSRQDEIPLTKELECLSYYLNLEQLRLGDKLSFHIDVDPGLDQEKVHIVPMLIQPFVENAIWHGISLKPSPGKLSIGIKKQGKETLECTVEDDGIGRERSRELQGDSVLERESLGMILTEERITALNNMKEAKIEIIDLKDPNNQPLGTRVIIQLPLSIRET